jgi:hypothetical protein
MLPQDIRRIMKENDRYARMLEYYDRTGRFPLDKIRRSYTLKEINIARLKKASNKTGKSMSDILDGLLEKMGDEHGMRGTGWKGR